MLSKCAKRQILPRKDGTSIPTVYLEHFPIPSHSSSVLKRPNGPLRECCVRVDCESIGPKLAYALQNGHWALPERHTIDLDHTGAILQIRDTPESTTNHWDIPKNQPMETWSAGRKCDSPYPMRYRFVPSSTVPPIEESSSCRHGIAVTLVRHLW
jgi:hypothetical protein